LLSEIHTRKHDENIAEEETDDKKDVVEVEQTTSSTVTHIEITTERRSLHEIKPECQHVDDGKIVDLS
jgi:hypothetical protein